MKLRMICMALALMALASVSFGQFNAILYTTDTFTNGCEGAGEMLEDGANVVSVYWDANNNGPDAADVVAPDAVQSLYALNGNDYLGIPGAWYSDPAFTYNAFTPAVSKFYVVVDGAQARYTSRVLTIGNGFSEHDLSGSFTCTVTAVPCDEPTEINIETVGGRNFLTPGAVYTYCFNACANTTVTICLGPLAADEMPIAGFGECQGTPAQFAVNGGWVYNATAGTWCLQIVVATEGCICFRLDDILAAELGSFDAVARDNSVELRWNTISESNVESFSVLRKIAGHESFDLIGNVAAANSATGATYSFVDNGAVNGTSYEYTLETVNLSGSRESWGVIASATPSVDAAVVTEYALHQNYPNPFNPSTNLVFDVVAENVVNLTVYNAMGQEVASLVNGTMAAGRHTVSFDAANLTSGLYFYTVKIGNEFTATKKMLLVK
ncbi:MAG: T9SS type A sorting domain-containing protein [bacterium]|nr:T9SS type A sorting domain-containing protein [bacterium]